MQAAASLDRPQNEEAVPPAPPATGDVGFGPTGPLRRFLALAAAIVLAGCGSGAGGTFDTTLHVRGRVALGAVDGATVSAYRLGEYDVPLATATSSAGATAAEVGRFTLSLPKLPADAMVLLVASGGTARDVDEDGVMGDEAANYSRIHALARAGELERGEVLLSAVTDLVYQRVQYFLRALYDDAFVARACDAWSSFVLRGNVAGGPAIDNEDALAFDPRLHAGTTFRPYAPFLHDYVDTVLADGPTLKEKAFALTREQIHFEDLPGEDRGVALVGNVAYLCRGAAGLETRDVSDPVYPQLLGTHDTPGTATEVQVVGTLAYVADGAGGLRILNVSDPTVPTHVGALVLPWGPVVTVHVVANLAYVCTTGPLTGSKLAIVNVANPASPTLLSSTFTDDLPTRVRVAGGFAYVHEQRRVETFEVTDPLQPTYRSVVYTQANTQADVAAGHLFVADDARLEVFSLVTPSAPLSVGSCPLPGPGVRGLRVHGTRALLTYGNSGLVLVDVADPTAPRFLGTIATSGSAADVAVSGGLGIVSSHRGGLATVALGTPAPSGVVASVPWTNGMDSVKAVGNRLYATSNLPAELVVFDTTDPLAPATLGHVPLVSSRGMDVAVAGDTAFVAESAGLEAYDVTHPDAPAFLDGVASATPLHGLAAGEGVVYTSNDSQVGVYAAPPSDLGTIALLPITGPGERVALEGGVLAVAAGEEGLVLYDAATPTAPVRRGTAPGSYAQDVALHWPFAFVAQFVPNRDFQVVQVVDCSDLGAPLPVRDVPFLGEVDRLVTSGNLLYASGWVSGVHVLDAQRAFPVGTIPVPAGIRDLDVDGAYVYVATRQSDRAVLILRAARIGVP